MDPFAWVVFDTPPIDYTPTWLSGGSYLAPMNEGAVLRWMYDETDEGTYSLLVRLTEEEAQKVFEDGPPNGMLESIRENLYWRGALIFVTDDAGRTVRSWRYIIQGDTSEDEFIDDLMSPPPRVFANALMAAEDRTNRNFIEPLLAGLRVGA